MANTLPPPAPAIPLTPSPYHFNADDEMVVTTGGPGNHWQFKVEHKPTRDILKAADREQKLALFHAWKDWYKNHPEFREHPYPDSAFAVQWFYFDAFRAVGECFDDPLGFYGYKTKPMKERPFEKSRVMGPLPEPYPPGSAHDGQKHLVFLQNFVTRPQPEIYPEAVPAQVKNRQGHVVTDIQQEMGVEDDCFAKFCRAYGMVFVPGARTWAPGNHPEVPEEGLVPKQVKATPWPGLSRLGLSHV